MNWHLDVGYPESPIPPFFFFQQSTSLPTRLLRTVQKTQRYLRNRQCRDYSGISTSVYEFARLLFQKKWMIWINSILDGMLHSYILERGGYPRQGFHRILASFLIWDSSILYTPQTGFLRSPFQILRKLKQYHWAYSKLFMKTSPAFIPRSLRLLYFMPLSPLVNASNSVTLSSYSMVIYFNVSVMCNRAYLKEQIDSR